MRQFGVTRHGKDYNDRRWQRQIVVEYMTTLLNQNISANPKTYRHNDYWSSRSDICLTLREIYAVNPGYPRDLKTSTDSAT